jgi:hypothetical protein
MDSIKIFYEGGHKNFYDIYNNINKEDTKEEYNIKPSNEGLNVSDVSKSSDKFSDKSGDKGKSYKVDMTAYSPDVQNLYDLWRNLGSPIKQHRNGSKTNHDAICALKKAVKLHDPDKIANAMLLYHKIISSAQDYKLSMRAPGHLIGLNEFFRFSDFTRSRIDKKNCAYDIQSWFDECMKGEVYIDRIYAKHKVENTDPEITTQLKKYWKTYISKEVPQSPGDEDCFRLAATKFRKFIKKNRNNVALHDNIDINNLPRDSKYLYEAIIEKTDNLKIVTPAWLCSDVMFKKRFPSYLYHQGMMDNDFDDDDDDQSDFVNQLHEMYGG